MGISCPICETSSGEFSKDFNKFTCKNCHCDLNLRQFVAKSLSEKLSFDDGEYTFRKSPESEMLGSVSYDYAVSGLRILSMNLKSSLLISNMLENRNVPYTVVQISPDELDGHCPICRSKIIISNGTQACCTKSNHFSFHDIETLVASLIKQRYPKLDVSIKLGSSADGETKTIYIVKKGTVEKTVDNPKKGWFKPTTIQVDVEEFIDFGMVVKNNGEECVVWVPKSLRKNGLNVVQLINGEQIRNLRAVEVNL